MPDGALTPPELELIVIGVAGGSAGSGAPTSVSVRMPATFVNGPAPSGFGSNRTPVVVRYGFSVRVAFASDVLPWTMSRCFWTRYSTEVTNTVSGSGLTVTVAVAGADGREGRGRRVGRSEAAGRGRPGEGDRARAGRGGGETGRGARGDRVRATGADGHRDASRRRDDAARPRIELPGDHAGARGIATLGEELDGVEVVGDDRGARDVLREDVLDRRVAVLAPGDAVRRRRGSASLGLRDPRALDHRADFTRRREERVARVHDAGLVRLGGNGAERIAMRAEAATAADGAARCTLVDADGAVVAIAGGAGERVEVDAVEVDVAARVGRHAYEPGAERRLADAEDREAAGAEERGVGHDVRRVCARRGPDADVVGDGPGGDVGPGHAVERPGAGGGRRAVLHGDAREGHVVTDFERRLEVGIRHHASEPRDAGIVDEDGAGGRARHTVDRTHCLRAERVGLGGAQSGRSRAREAHRVARSGHDGRVRGLDAEEHVGRGGGAAVAAGGIVDPHAGARAERVRRGGSTLGAVRVVDEAAHAELTERVVDEVDEARAGVQ